MTKVSSRREYAVEGVIGLVMISVFVADIFTPLGVVDWIVYLVPLVLCLSLWRAALPIALASVETLLLVVGYLLSPPGVSQQTAMINRGLGILTVWIAGFVVFKAIQNKLEVKRQRWLQSAQTGLSEEMRGEKPLETFGEGVLLFLTEYLEAQGSAIFVEDGGSFHRFAQRALSRDSGVPENFLPGEGLHGQAAKDGRILVVNDLPAGYFKLGSGLGQAQPRHLLIAPVSVDGGVKGVLEFGFLRPITGVETELLERVSESIAVAIRTSRDRNRLHELLEETQRQAEELQAQSEELRVSNEELEEQSRALKESQARLEEQQAELEQTNLSLEQQTQVLETQKQNLSLAKAELEAQTTELKQASRYKSDFVANMSHELRTPLNSSLILAKLLADNREGNLTPEQIKYAQTIHAAGNDLLALITEILDLSKIEAGRMDIRPEDIQLTAILENLRRMFQPVAAEKKLGFTIRIAAGTPESFRTDPQRIEQVLKNLLSNAMKFTEKGEVSLEVERDSSGHMIFHVKDSGVGIPANQQSVIFEPFRQADGTTGRAYGGTGLGLSISRELTKLLGGEIRLTSEAGKGSTFSVVLPQVYKPQSSRAEKPASAPSALSESVVKAAPVPTVQRAEKLPVEDDRHRLRPDSRVILVVEDDAVFASILSDLGHELGFECIIATTCEEALAMAIQFSPRAVVLDVGLPDNSGLSVLDRLKADSRTRHIPVHVVSATDHTETALSLGAVGYMLKPVSRDQLVQAFQRLETSFTHRLRRVLVVEDDPVQLESVQQLLRSAEVETIGARNASECLEILKGTTVDCMVLDLTLPDASGFSLLRTLSQDDAYSFPPVIVYTGRDLHPDEEEMLRRYSKSIILKGAKSPERLLDEVTLFLHQVVSEMPVEKQRMLAKAHNRDAVLEERHILIAEDDVRNIFALTSTLEPRGAKPRIARNGREAIEALQQAEEAGQPISLVLMDIMMPEMDGLTAIREIRKRAEWKKLPIIALTAKAMKSDQEACLGAGANDYMAKPLDVEKLLSLIRVWMPR